MQMFEYVMVLASIIIGLAITHLLQGIGRQVSEVTASEPHPPCTGDDIAKRLMDRVRRAAGAQLMRRLLDHVQIEIDVGALDHGNSIHLTRLH